MISLLSELGIKEPYLRLLVVSFISLLIGIIVRFLFFKILFLLNKKKSRRTVELLQDRFEGSIFLFLPVLIIHTLIPKFGLEEDFRSALHIITEVLIIVSFTIVVIRLVFFLQDVLYGKFNDDSDVKGRQVITQIVFFRKLITFVIILVAVCLILMQFDSVRKYGATILTSAGVAGIIIGFAAQKTLANFLAGLQIAFTQPIKIGDALYVEDEWGWVEEINLTYIVIKIWDRRRLVLPITYFTEQVYENWTKRHSDINGTVFIYTDYTIPVNAIRRKFEQILEDTALWDGNSQIVQVTGASEKTMEIRLLMSAKNSMISWDLRCHVREEIITFIQKEYPEALPKTRLELNHLPDSKT
ncbi:mechanosensitive ion channel family protein [Marivirga arenosa]|uniref:Mechanosensitive ion channel n=1 Tax=Marivirga arenosa TaxID=3059076 RepID=A0AA49JHC9_9BACT|nr:MULTISPECIES: mechanosensitive ion channel domain-containing protein [unclassified Marivirga]WKK79693.2 mechanosensitive ion channel [Marivirga sp. BKB1-2]WKK85219.2 mechanosensitive ion channel [Marivirga sp. ABR2-2]